MGIDLLLRLPGNVRVGDVANVIGKLLGCKAEKATFENTPGWYTKVPHAKVKSVESLPECCNIVIEDPAGKVERVLLYHFEPEFHGRLIMLGSTPENVALARAVVDFFGGSVDYNDCDSKKRDYHVKAKPDLDNCPDNSEAWEWFQDRILKLDPISKKTIKECREFAAYK